MLDLSKKEEDEIKQSMKDRLKKDPPEKRDHQILKEGDIVDRSGRKYVVRHDGWRRLPDLDKFKG